MSAEEIIEETANDTAETIDTTDTTDTTDTIDTIDTTVADATDETVDDESTEELNLAKIDPDKLAPAVEAILFASADPTPSTKLSEAFGRVGVSAIKNAIGELNEKYENGGHTFRIRQIGGGYQFFVMPSYTDYVKRLYTKERKLRLTKAALETMAIIAYKQPISKNQVEYIRGVACDGVVSNLLEKSLIKISGRSESVGRPLLYSATDEFLKFFGLNTFDELPRIAEVEEMIAEMEAERLLRHPESAEAEQSEQAEQTVELDFSSTENNTENSESNEDSGSDSEAEIVSDLESDLESETESATDPETTLESDELESNEDEVVEDLSAKTSESASTEPVQTTE